VEAADTTRPTVHVVEDDDSARVATARLLRASGHAVRTYGSAEEFLAGVTAGTPGCVVLDLRLPGPSGLDLQESLVRTDDPLPIIFLTGHGRIPDTVRAMKSGAVDFLTKPVPGDVLLEAVSRALARDVEEHAVRLRRRDLRSRYDLLTPREREVFAHLISGQLNKQVGFDLGTSERTIKAHRAHVLDKMRAASIAELVRMATDLGIAPVGAVQ
jgi:FixJ family two-component response regulator